MSGWNQGGYGQQPGYGQQAPGAQQGSNQQNAQAQQYGAQQQVWRLSFTCNYGHVARSRPPQLSSTAIYIADLFNLPYLLFASFLSFIVTEVLKLLEIMLWCRFLCLALYTHRIGKPIRRGYKSSNQCRASMHTEISSKR